MDRRVHTKSRSGWAASRTFGLGVAAFLPLVACQADPTATAPEPSSECRTDLTLTTSGGTASVTAHAAADVLSDGSYVYVAAADGRIDPTSVLATGVEQGQQMVGIVLRGPDTRAFRTGDVVRPERPQSSDSTNFTLVAQVDGDFVPPPESVADDSAVDIVSLSVDRACLVVDYRDTELRVTGTIDADVRAS